GRGQAQSSPNQGAVGARMVSSTAELQPLRKEDQGPDEKGKIHRLGHCGRLQVNDVWIQGKSRSCKPRRKSHGCADLGAGSIGENSPNHPENSKRTEYIG